MKIVFNKIYIVVCTDYIDKSYYKHCLSIEENVMADVVLKCI